MYDKIQVYEDQLLPLVEQVFEIARENNVQVMIQVLLKQELEGDSQTDKIAAMRVRGEGEPPDAFLLINAMVAGQLQAEHVFEALWVYERFKAFKEAMCDHALKEVPPAGNA